MQTSEAVSETGRSKNINPAMRHDRHTGYNRKDLTMHTDYKTTPAGRAVIDKYSDILHQTRPEPSYRHPRMSLQNRAKIFSPFAALRGYDEEIKAEQLNQRMEERPELPEEDRERLSDKLHLLRKGMKITVCYFEALSTGSAAAASYDAHTAESSPTGICQTITAAVGSVDLVHCELRLYTGNVNAFGKELPVVIAFDDILELTLITEDS